MRRSRRRSAGITASFCEALESRQLMSADVLTYHNDNARTGENLNETVLTPGNVNKESFGKVGQVAVDGQVYAQPLIKSRVAVPGRGIHNIAFVATEHDSVYAFDANSLAPIWHDSFIKPSSGVTSVPSTDARTTDLTPEIGITGTPVIDPTTSTLYVVAKTKEGFDKSVQYVQRLHALDLATGAEKFGGPAVIKANVPGSGSGNHNGLISFNPLLANQRSGLLLLDGVVYISWASHSDNGPYHGWIMGYNARTLKRASVFNTTPDGSDGGVWMSGAAPAADTNHNIFLATGNGSFDANRKGRDYGDSVIKLSTAGGPAVTDYFAPVNQATLKRFDIDLGSGGVLLVPDQPGPHPHLLVAAGKQGRIYLLDRNALGKFNDNSDTAIQTLPRTLIRNFSTPAYFNGTIYFVGSPLRDTGSGDLLKAFHLSDGLLDSTPTTGTFTYGYPGSTPSISANKTTNGIVWTLDNGGAASQDPAILRASDARDVSHELYDSTQKGPQDHAGPAVKFSVPTVANGKVYVGGQGTLTVYGEFSHPGSRVSLSRNRIMASALRHKTQVA